MNEERLAKLENMMIDTLRIVGNTNALVEELKQDLDEVKQELEEVKDIQTEHSETLQEHSKILKEMMFKMDNIKPIEQMLGEHEIAIRNIRNRII